MAETVHFLPCIQCDKVERISRVYNVVLMSISAIIGGLATKQDPVVLATRDTFSVCGSCPFSRHIDH
jgi:hypothetical protein